MLDLGLDVLFKGKNMARLLGGLGVALKISAVSVIISLPLGILLGVLGIVGVGLNYPVYKKLLRSGKEKYAFEIMQLAREISEAGE